MIKIHLGIDPIPNSHQNSLFIRSYELKYIIKLKNIISSFKIFSFILIIHIGNFDKSVFLFIFYS